MNNVLQTSANFDSVSLRNKLDTIGVDVDVRDEDTRAVLVTSALAELF